MGLVLGLPPLKLFWEVLENLLRYDLPGGSRFLGFRCIPFFLFLVYCEMNNPLSLHVTIVHLLLFCCCDEIL